MMLSLRPIEFMCLVLMVYSFLLADALGA